MTTRSYPSLPGLNRRLTLEPDRGRVRELLLALALAAVMLLPLLLHVWQSSEWVRAGYRMEQLKNQRDRLTEVNHQLLLERSSLENLARIEALAADQLGLAQPPSGTVVLVDRDELVPARRPAGARVASTRAVTLQGGTDRDAASAHAAN